jgi:hypothetical protein
MRRDRRGPQQTPGWADALGRRAARLGGPLALVIAAAGAQAPVAPPDFHRVIADPKRGGEFLGGEKVGGAQVVAKARRPPGGAKPLDAIAGEDLAGPGGEALGIEERGDLRIGVVACWTARATSIARGVTVATSNSPIAASMAVPSTLWHVGSASRWPRRWQ